MSNEKEKKRFNFRKLIFKDEEETQENVEEVTENVENSQTTLKGTITSSTALFTPNNDIVGKSKQEIVDRIEELLDKDGGEIQNTAFQQLTASAKSMENVISDASLRLQAAFATLQLPDKNVVIASIDECLNRIRTEEASVLKDFEIEGNKTLGVKQEVIDVSKQKQQETQNTIKEYEDKIVELKNHLKSEQDNEITLTNDLQNREIEYKQQKADWIASVKVVIDALEINKENIINALK